MTSPFGSPTHWTRSVSTSSFHLIHFDTAFKVDVFVASNDPWLTEERGRRKRVSITTDDQCLNVSSPEDNILHKLKWYDTGGEVSDQQWRDVLGVMKVQGQDLDLSYLRQWASYLGLEDLLDKALTEAGLDSSGA